MICQRLFFSFPFILISEFCCDTTQVIPYRPHRELESIILADRAREERLIPRCWDLTFNEYMNVAALCYSVFVVQFVPQERPMYVQLHLHDYALMHAVPNKYF